MKSFLMACRKLLIIPVIGCVLLTFGAVVMGFGRIVTAGVKIFRAQPFSPEASKMVATAVIEIIDLFLVGTVAYITAVGLWKLFITAEKDVKLPFRIRIGSLKELEDKIVGVMIAALAVAFLGKGCYHHGPSGDAFLWRGNSPGHWRTHIFPE